MILTLNNIPLTSVQLTLPFNGVWVGDILLSTDDQVSLGKGYKLNIDNVSLSCSIISLVNNNGLIEARVVGGAGGLSFAPKSPRNMVNPTGLDIIKSFADDGGERVGYTAEDLSKREFANFQTFASLPIGWQLGHFLSQYGYHYYLNDDGEITVQHIDNTQTVQLPDDATLVKSTPDGSKVYSYSSLDSFPKVGDSLDGQTVKLLTITANNTSLFLCFSFTEQQNLLKESAISSVFNASYSATVVGQNDDGPEGTLGGTLQIIPDDPMLRGGGMDRVPMRLLQGYAVRVPEGSRVTIRFDQKNGNKPFVDSFIQPGDYSQLPVSSANNLHCFGDPNKADFVALAELVMSNLSNIESMLSDIKAKYNTHSHGANGANPPVAAQQITSSYSKEEVKSNQLKSS